MSLLRATPPTPPTTHFVRQTQLSWRLLRRLAFVISLPGLLMFVNWLTKNALDFDCTSTMEALLPSVVCGPPFCQLAFLVLHIWFASCRHSICPHSPLCDVVFVCLIAGNWCVYYRCSFLKVVALAPNW